MQGGCAKEFDLKSHATQDVEDGWARLLFPTADFECNQAVSLWQQVAAIQLERQGDCAVPARCNADPGLRDSVVLVWPCCRYCLAMSTGCNSRIAPLARGRSV